MWFIASASSKEYPFHTQNGMLAGPEAVLSIRDRAVKTGISAKLGALWLVSNSNLVGATQLGSVLISWKCVLITFTSSWHHGVRTRSVMLLYFLPSNLPVADPKSP